MFVKFMCRGMKEICFDRILALLFTAAISSVESTLNASRSSEILASFSAGHDDHHSVHMIPRRKGEQVKVLLGFYLLNMVPLTFINNHIYLELDLRAQWVDRRLKFENSSTAETLTLQGTDTDTIWKPDIFILGENGQKHATYPPTLSAAWISPDGTVMLLIRLSVTVYCPMSMKMFPFDRQTCSVIFESFAYSTDQLRLGFLNTSSGSPVHIEEHFRISKFQLQNYTLSKLSVDYGLTGIFDQLKIEFHFRRDIRFYIMEYYVPIICVVCLSFLSFWIHCSATPARVALPVTTFLTLTRMLDHVRQSTNVFGTADALEIFLNVSNVFVLANMLEFALVGILSRKSHDLVNEANDERRSRQASNEQSVSCSHQKNNQELINDENDEVTAIEDAKSRNSLAVLTSAFGNWLKNKKQKCAREVHYLDKICRYLFPLIYALFLFLYSLFYATSLLIT